MRLSEATSNTTKFLIQECQIKFHFMREFGRAVPREKGIVLINIQQITVDFQIISVLEKRRI
jgi:hypothetical protein